MVFQGDYKSSAVLLLGYACLYHPTILEEDWQIYGGPIESLIYCMEGDWFIHTIFHLNELRQTRMRGLEGVDFLSTHL